MKRLFRKSKIISLNAKADEEYADDQNPDDRSEEFIERSKLMREFFNWKYGGNRMNPENSVEDLDLFDSEPKAEIGEGLDIKADEDFADHENLLSMKKAFNIYVDESLYDSASRLLEFASRWKKLINDEEKHKWSLE